MDLSRAKSVPREPAYFWSHFTTGYYYQCEGLFELQCSRIAFRYGAGVPPTHGSFTISVVSKMHWIL
jgi:hypothetical protein